MHAGEWLKYHRGIRACLHERRVTQAGEETLLGGQWWSNPPVDIVFDMHGHPTHHLNVIKLKWEIICWKAGYPPKRVNSPIY